MLKRRTNEIFFLEGLQQRMSMSNTNYRGLSLVDNWDRGLSNATIEWETRGRYDKGNLRRSKISRLFLQEIRSELLNGISINKFNRSLCWSNRKRWTSLDRNTHNKSQSHIRSIHFPIKSSSQWRMNTGKQQHNGGLNGHLGCKPINHASYVQTA